MPAASDGALVLPARLPDDVLDAMVRETTLDPAVIGAEAVFVLVRPSGTELWHGTEGCVAIQVSLSATGPMERRPVTLGELGGIEGLCGCVSMPQLNGRTRCRGVLFSELAAADGQLRSAEYALSTPDVNGWRIGHILTVVRRYGFASRYGAPVLARIEAICRARLAAVGVPIDGEAGEAALAVMLDLVATTGNLDEAAVTAAAVTA